MPTNEGVKSDLGDLWYIDENEKILSNCLLHIIGLVVSDDIDHFSKLDPQFLCSDFGT